MEFKSGNCDSDCKIGALAHNCKFIVLTGGPGAGKTAVLEAAKKIFCDHVAFIPESAGIIFQGGFWRMPGPSAKKAAQRAIYHIQREMEKLVMEEKKWGIALCDRGALDGLAYWIEEEKTFWESFNTSKKKEYAKYEAIIHLQTPDASNGYNHQNPLRTETAEEAARIDMKIKKIWCDHPGYLAIESKNFFLDKVNACCQKINELIENQIAPR